MSKGPGRIERAIRELFDASPDRAFLTADRVKHCFFRRRSALGDDARPRVEDIAAFRVPGDRLIKLHVGTWHAGPHFVHDECLFVNLENLDTNRRDFHAVPLSVECRYRL